MALCVWCSKTTLRMQVYFQIDCFFSIQVIIYNIKRHLLKLRNCFQSRSVSGCFLWYIFGIMFWCSGSEVVYVYISFVINITTGWHKQWVGYLKWHYDDVESSSFPWVLSHYHISAHSYIIISQLCVSIVFILTLVGSDSMSCHPLATGQHWSLHQGCDPEEPGGSLPCDLWPGPKADLRPDGERLLRAFPPIWAVPGAPGQLSLSGSLRSLGGEAGSFQTAVS